MDNTKPANMFVRVVRPLQNFLHTEASGGILLMVAAVVAMVWANSPFKDVYFGIWETRLTLGVGEGAVSFTVREFVSDGLMSIFFLVVGMEVKRELVVGELRTPSRAMLPLAAAVGGMVIPAAIYVALNLGGDGLKGWAIPMATDIAFAVGILTLLRGRVQYGLVVFLTALAIFDDIGGIIVIALFYGKGLHLGWLAIAAVITIVLIVMGRAHVRNGLLYALIGAFLWIAVHDGGIHATIAGVILGLCIPARALRSPRRMIEDLHAFSGELVSKPDHENITSHQILQIEEKIEDMESPINRFIHALHPYVSWFIVPLFALANAGVSLEGLSLGELANPIPLGATLGLFLGKQLGIFGFTVAAVKMGVAPIPGDASYVKLYGVGLIAGIGFTVALFIGGLAFGDTPALLEEAKLGILLGSALSGIGGYLLLRFSGTVPVEKA